MRFRNSACAIFLVATLFLVPLYSVYAQDSSSSGNLKPSFLQNRDQKLNSLQAQFNSRIVDMRAKIASREADFKNRLNNFQNQVKAQIAQKVNHNLNMINQNQTTLMNKNLDTMSSILDRVVNKVGGSASSSAQVATARTAIDTARNSVITQAGKDYTINISTESGIQKDAQAARDKLRADLKATRDLVVAAKQTVITAIRSMLNQNALASPNASSSATLKTKDASATGLPVSQ